MIFNVYEGEVLLDTIEVSSVGGGDILYLGQLSNREKIYPQYSFDEITAYCKTNNVNLFDYILSVEDESFYDFISDVWSTMKQTIKTGLQTEGVLPGTLEVVRKANVLLKKRIYR